MPLACSRASSKDDPAFLRIYGIYYLPQQKTESNLHAQGGTEVATAAKQKRREAMNERLHAGQQMMCDQVALSALQQSNQHIKDLSRT
jgi:aspartate oxidase